MNTNWCKAYHTQPLGDTLHTEEEEKEEEKGEEEEAEEEEEEEGEREEEVCMYVVFIDCIFQYKKSSYIMNKSRTKDKTELRNLNKA